MCGISGILGTNIERQKLEAMLRVQDHRGPDDSGVWVSQNGVIGLGHNRLSIIDLSSAGHQPMTDGRGVWLVFNGEIYNHLELRDQLVLYDYKSNSDSEVILAAWARWGKACVNHFVGMFAFALWDENTQSLFCARDRLGQKPFHYAHVGGQLLFASEVKALHAAGLIAKPNQRIWADYLVNGFYDHTEETFFQDVMSLPPGSSLEVHKGKLKINQYWSPFNNQELDLSLSDEEVSQRFLYLMEESVRLRLRADVPVGINLSGGLDSSLLFTLADSLFKDDSGKIETFTAVFNSEIYDEKIFAKSIPRKSAWEANYVSLSPHECWSELEEMLWFQEAPVGGVATVAYHKLHKAARAKGVRVLLEAQGADEIFGGYPYYLPAYWADLFKSGNFQLMKQEIRSLPPEQRVHWLKLLKTLLKEGSFSSHYDGTSHTQNLGLSRDIRILATSSDNLWDYKSDEFKKALWRDTRYTKLPRVLRMNDRLSMASSTELRDPFLDHRLVEFAFSLPSRFKIRAGQGKFVMRHAMDGLLPHKIIKNKKRMVVTPQREWLRGDLRQPVGDLIESISFRNRGWFDLADARKAFEHFMSGKGDNSFFLWQWINAELWCRRFID